MKNVMLKDKVYIIAMLDLWILVFRLSYGTVLGSVIGGQVLPEHPDEEKFRGVAR